MRGSERTDGTSAAATFRASVSGRRGGGRRGGAAASAAAVAASAAAASAAEASGLAASSAAALRGGSESGGGLDLSSLIQPKPTRLQCCNQAEDASFEL